MGSVFARNVRLTASILLCGAILVGTGRALAQDPAPAPAPEGVDGGEVLTRGVVHEAFADLPPLAPEPGIVVSKAPPGPIDEIPPDVKPEGDVVWIPGYWAWDDDRSDFIWVSGIWR